MIRFSVFAAVAVLILSKPAHPQASQFDAFIDNYYKSGEPGGVALISKNGRVIYRRAFGMANLEQNATMRPDAVFSIASMTKQFTAVAVLQQVEKGTIALSDTVGKFLPDFPQALKGISIEQLLAHTAGVSNAKSIASLLAQGRGWLSAAQVVATFKDEPLDFAPGTNWSYSNSGYQLLGYIVEKVTGEPFPEFIEKTLLKPAGMEHSLWGNDMRVIAGRASPYLFTRNGFENAMNPNVQIAWAAGAIQSTADDLFNWNQSLKSGKLLSKPMLEKAWTPATLRDGTVTDYGFGWYIGQLQGSPLVEHGGNMGGYMSHAIYLPREDVLVVVLLNSRGKRLPELIATDLAAAAIGRPLAMNPIPLADDVARSVAGVYRNKSNAEVTISVENGKLFYQRRGGPRFGLTPYATDKFMFDNTSTIGEAQRDRSGAVTGFAMQTIRGQSKSYIRRDAMH